MSQGTTPNPAEASLADVWYLKEIQYGTKDVKQTYKIITQNFNGCEKLKSSFQFKGWLEILSDAPVVNDERR
ncbi:hypothetical protein CC1G_14460 [Coprinopsis cinerea okayama7|uniref:Uncharacterized protein n=1 Tax=Coprinopsis cinerea (strain Okayama-7 / 130 / ATCC MYA-4618 / FGSC 9003) TaxID=240176 RepID=D6RM39_COPC7|nr:hypothetical protein CC1G_14460 [Coprinopsis cinerea okayama7\|eukprot:XP_002911462.1 hypothetical protein CC1G_14460 [Coprinopsis cinerea okayama7\